MRTKYFLLVHTPQAFWQSSAPRALSTLVTSVVLYWLTRATPASSGKDETRIYIYKIINIAYINIKILYINIYIYKYSHPLHCPEVIFMSLSKRGSQSRNKGLIIMTKRKHR